MRTGAGAWRVPPWLCAPHGCDVTRASCSVAFLGFLHDYNTPKVVCRKVSVHPALPHGSVARFLDSVFISRVVGQRDHDNVFFSFVWLVNATITVSVDWWFRPVRGA